jgi:hypothetical protein
MSAKIPRPTLLVMAMNRFATLYFYVKRPSGINP